MDRRQPPLPESPQSSTASTTDPANAVTQASTTGAASSSSTPLSTTVTLLTTSAPTPAGVVPCTTPDNGQKCLWGADNSLTTLSTITWTQSTAIDGLQTSVVVVGLESVASSVASSTSHSSTTPSVSGSASSAPQASDTNKPASSPAKSTDTAAIAGAAVGCFIGGALIAAFACFLFFKRRSQHDRRTTGSSYVIAPTPTHGTEKDMPVVSVAPAGTFDFLPQQADDAEVQRKLSTVTDQIDQHVENFYSNRNIPLDATLEAELSRFETSQLPQPLAACFEYAASPTVLIKHCLAFHIFNLTLAPGEGTHPLLPPELAGMVGAVYNRSLSSSASKGKHKALWEIESANTIADTIAAFSSWKALTKYLRPDLARHPTASRSTSENTSRIASNFTNVFSPWANREYSNEHRNRHLTELINHAIQTATWLFGQPDMFRFDWTVPVQEIRHSTGGGNGTSVIVVPAVFKVTHNGARLGGRGQSVLSPIITRC